MKKLVFTLGIVAITLAASAQVTGTFGQGLNFEAPDKSFSLKFGLRIQPFLAIDYRDFEQFTNPQLDEIQMTIRRARLKFDGYAFNPKLEYKLELALGQRNLGGVDVHTGGGARLVLDAVIKYQFAPGYYLWFGQTKLPGNRERVISSQKLQFVDRSIVNGRFNIDRDMGFQLHIKKKLADKPLNLAFALSMGEGRNIAEFNAGGLEYTGRVEFLPFGAFKNKGDYSGADLEREETVKTSIGITFDYNDRAVRQRGNQGNYVVDTNLNLVTQSLSTWFVDLMTKYNGWALEAEFAHKTAPNPIVFVGANRFDAFYTGWGISSQLGYVFPSNWEFGGRYSFVAPEELVDLKLGNQTQYTAVISKYIHGHSLKIQSDITYSVFEIADPGWQFRFQVEVAL